MKVSKADKENAYKMLHVILKPGDTVYSVIRAVSRSGMSRKIDFYGPDHEYLTGYISNLCGYSRDKSGALKVSGCGMDMAFSVVYDLGKAMWPNGTPAPHGRRNGEPDSDGGYALKSWIL